VTLPGWSPRDRFSIGTNDLPALTKRANAICDRLHRGTLIDLEVAREMMALDSPSPEVINARIEDEDKGEGRMPCEMADNRNASSGLDVTP
jgi:hypothetical protein